MEAGGVYQAHYGMVSHDDLIGAAWGSKSSSHLGKAVIALEPTLRDVLLNIPRRSQVIFPKDIGYILLRLNLGPEMTVMEAGTGSGALTTALAWAVGSEGRVISCDRREDMQALARENLEQVGLEPRVEFVHRDVGSGFPVQGVDAIFLDLPGADAHVPAARRALRAGGALGAIMPTANQVSDFIHALDGEDFFQIDLCEIMLRFYKPVAARIRPQDRMVAHTGYLIFARAMARTAESSEDLDDPHPHIA
jgi:tRNA (adenine57-N1/adenine58-N1)-methyltransferase